MRADHFNIHTVYAEERHRDFRAEAVRHRLTIEALSGGDADAIRTDGVRWAIGSRLVRLGERIHGDLALTTSHPAHCAQASSVAS